MVTSPTGKGVIVMGGLNWHLWATKAIFELSASMQWTKLEQTLKIGHWKPVAIPIPDELVFEKIKEKGNFKFSAVAFSILDEFVFVLKQPLTTFLLAHIILALLMYHFLKIISLYF